MIGLSLITAPVSEPVSVATLKNHLRINLDDEDTELQAYIATARQVFENYSGLALGTQTWKLTLDDWPQDQTIYLPKSPAQSVTHVKYWDTTGTQTTYSSGNYILDTQSRPARIYLPITLPTVHPYRQGNIEVQYVCGETTIPQAINTAIMLLAGTYYANREATLEMPLAELPFGFQVIVNQYKTSWGARDDSPSESIKRLCEKTLSPNGARDFSHSL